MIRVWKTKVRCSVSGTELENEDGLLIDSVCAICLRCGHETESFGTSQASILRCLVLMREECPRDENNFYIEDEI